MASPDCGERAKTMNHGSQKMVLTNVSFSFLEKNYILGKGPHKSNGRRKTRGG